MHLSRIITALTPPALAWRLGRRARERRELERFSAFYRSFVGPGDLCFDIGANLGNRTRCFRALGCRVVAVEPQARCLARLRKEFGRDPQVAIVPKALGRAVGKATLRVSRDHVLSSLSEAFMRATTASGRFAGAAWDGAEEVEVTTLDALVREFSVPGFVKIDVEGYEKEVLAGLTAAVPALSFEWTPELADAARECIDRLASLGDYEFNISWGESMRFSRPEWRNPESLRRIIDEFQGESLLFGDIYARLPR